MKCLYNVYILSPDGFIVDTHFRVDYREVLQLVKKHHNVSVLNLFEQTSKHYIDGKKV